MYVKELDIFLTESPRKQRQQYCRSESFAMKTDILMNGSMVKIHISLKTGFGYNVVVRNFVPIVVPGLSTSSSSSSYHSTSKTPSRQERPCSTSSSSSSSSPTTSSSDNVTREREDGTESDISPVTASTTDDERAVPRAENFGDLITADHKVLSDNCEFRNNHRYAVVVQDLTTPMDPVVSVQNNNFSGNTKELAEVLGAR